jgi:hypothetical protein
VESPLSPTAYPASLVLMATLNVEPGRSPKLMTLPPFHSAAVSNPARTLPPRHLSRGITTRRVWRTFQVDAAAAEAASTLGGDGSRLAPRSFRPRLIFRIATWQMLTRYLNGYNAL